MRSNLTDLTVVIDRSGSMEECRTDAEGGMNSFIRAQKELSGDCNFSLVQFDTVYEFLYRAVPIREVTTAYELHPRGSTALLDAVGRAIVETGERLRNMDEAERPALVVFVIITDGEENSSKEFTRSKIKEMIEHQTNVYKWQFTFLGANQDSFAEAGEMGIPQNCVTDYAADKTCGAILTASQSVARMRHATMTGQTVVNAYTDEERSAVK